MQRALLSRREMWLVLALLIFSVVVGVYFYATFVVRMCGPVSGMDAEQAARHACSGAGSHLAPT